MKIFLKIRDIRTIIEMFDPQSETNGHSEKIYLIYPLHPGRLRWNLQITHVQRKMIFQTSMIMFPVKGVYPDPKLKVKNLSIFELEALEL